MAGFPDPVANDSCSDSRIWSSLSRKVRRFEFLGFTSSYSMSSSFPISRSALSREAGNALVGEVQQPRALTELEHYQILEKWNQTPRDYPRDHCIHQLIERQAEYNPQAIAVEQADARLTYQELNDRSNQLAHILIRMGVRCESHVAIFLQRSPEMALALLATLKAGAACVPLDPQYPLER